MKFSQLIRRKTQPSPPPPQQPPDEIRSQPSYKPLPQPQTDCRLLCVLPGRISDPIICTTSVISVAEAVGIYHALSYCWGSQDRTRAVTCDKAAIEVTPNLESALRRLRAPDVSRNLWIDQLCIDQDNLREKEQQLGLMANIYRNSCKVLIWLGDEGDDSRKAYKLSERLLKLDPHASLGRIDRDDDLPPQAKGSIGLDQLKSHGLPGPKDASWQELRALLSRPWFSRIWAIQEAAVATEAEFLWGKDSSVAWQSMVTIVRLVRERLPRTLLGSDIVLRGLPADSVYRIAATKRRLEDGTRHDLFNLALTYKAYGASKAHDKLFALLNISDSLQTADYAQSVERTFHKMAYQEITKVYEKLARPPEELSQQQWHPYPGISQIPHLRMVALICSAGIANQQLSLPSWVPDWTVDSFPAPIWTRKTSSKNLAPAHNTSDSPDLPPADRPLERSTIPNSTHLAEIRWSTESSDNIPIGCQSLPDTLHIKAHICDTVSRRGFAKVELGRPLEHEDQQRALMEWFLEADDLADLGPETSHSGGGADADLFTRALLFDDDVGGVVSRHDDVVERPAQQLNLVERPEQQLDVERPDQQQQLLGKALRFTKHKRFVNNMKRKLSPRGYERAFANIPGRAFFVTQGGRMGLAPLCTHMYDRIATVVGFGVPLVLRPEGDGYRVVGECWAGNDDGMAGGLGCGELVTEWIAIK